jgi:6-phosphogluconate dehydrogenase
MGPGVGQRTVPRRGRDGPGTERREALQLGMVGLGRMGANLVRRLMKAGHECVVYNRSQEPVRQLETEGAIGSTSLDDLVAKLTPPRAAWIMVPAAVTGTVVNTIAERMDPGDIVIDGGNSNYRDDIERAAMLMGQKGVHFVDVGTSGGVFGLERGFCLMIGGDAETVRRLDPIWSALAPGVDAAPRTKGRSAGGTAEAGYLHCGPAGAGHFVKMIHNGVEYGLMASYAEGLSILAGAGIGNRPVEHDAETAPLREPALYRYSFDVADVAEVWRRGSVVASWLLDLTAAALAENPGLAGFSGRVSDSGEGRWTVLAAVEEGIPAPVLASALFSRFSSTVEGVFAGKVLTAML